MEKTPELARSDECRLTGVRGNLHRLLASFRDLQSPSEHSSRSREKEKRKDQDKQVLSNLQEIFDEAVEQNRISGTSDLPSYLEDEGIRACCLPYLVRARRRKRNRDYALRTDTATGKTSGTSCLCVPVVDGTCCFQCRRAEIVPSHESDKLLRRQRARTSIFVESETDSETSVTDDNNKERHTADESSSGSKNGAKAPPNSIQNSPGEDVISSRLFSKHSIGNAPKTESVQRSDESQPVSAPSGSAPLINTKTSVDAVGAAAHDVTTTEKHSQTQSEKSVTGVTKVESKPLTTSAPYAVIKWDLRPRHGHGNRKITDPIEIWKTLPKCVSSTEQITVVVTEKQTFKMRLLAKPNKYKITVIETTSDSETSSADSDSSSDTTTLACGCPSVYLSDVCLPMDDVSADDELDPCEDEQRKHKVVEIAPVAEKRQDIQLPHVSEKVASTSSESSSTDSGVAMRSRWRPEPPAISALGYCHRWGVMNILENLDARFVGFPRTDWARYIIRRRQVRYKMRFGNYLMAGEGVYGSVFRCLVTTSGKTEDAVIKFMRRMNTRGAKAIREAKVMGMLRKKCGDYVPKFLGVVYVKPDQTYVRWGLACEDIDDETFGLYGNTLNGACELHIELLSKMKKGNFTAPLPVPKKDWLFIMRDCASGLAYIHQCGVILNDLKANNVLLKRRERPQKGSNWRVTFIDFGLASFGPRGKVIDRNDLEYWRSKCWHIAPEIFKGSLSTHKSDIYSFGILLKPIVKMFNLSARYKSLRMSCVRCDPVARPKAATLVNELNFLARTEPNEENLQNQR